MTDAEFSAFIEFALMGTKLKLLAASRDVAATATGDQRFVAAADCIRRIAATLHAVDDEVLLRIATVDRISEGGMSKLIETRMEQTGFDLPLYEDAAEFLAPVTASVNRILTLRNLH